MTSGELLDFFRSQMRDQEMPYLWSDSEVYAYMDDAQKMFCRLTDGIADMTTQSVVQLAIAPNVTGIKLHKSILKIRTARLVSNGLPVEILNVEDMPARSIRFDGRVGPLSALIEGMEENTIVPWPVPNYTDTVQLVVFRLPLRTICGDEPLEIAEQHHQHLFKWMQHRAYGKQDAETVDKTKGKSAEEDFRAYCETAKLEQQRKRHKVRQVAYGGIPHQGAQYGDYWYTRGIP